MTPPSEGCALCGSTWGDYWADMDGERRFFCCAVCARQFEALVGEVRARTGWPRVATVRLEGDRRGRVGVARLGEAEFRFSVAFDSAGGLRRFKTRPMAGEHSRSS